MADAQKEGRPDWLEDGMDLNTSFLAEILSVDIPCTPSMAAPSQAGPNQSIQLTQASTEIQVDDDSFLNNSEPENEHVGVDEEEMYSEDELEPVSAKKKTEIDSDYSEELDLEEVEDEIEDEEGDDVPLHILELAYDNDDPPMEVGSTYPSMHEFRLALASHSIKHEFEYDIEKSEPEVFRAHCSAKQDGCNWRIHASTFGDGVTIKVKKNPSVHDCSSTRRSGKVRQATKFWICEKIKDWLVDNPRIKPKQVQQMLKEEYKIVIPYKRVYAGKELAMNQLFGDWRQSFNNLYKFKAQIEASCPGSLVTIDHHTINGKIRFNRFFFAMKPCIDGFLTGCRPYLAVDSTFLTGKFRGQLCIACAVDGHNWMYPVAVGVIDSETLENWKWFMERLKDAIGSPPGLTFCTDAGQAVMASVEEVFPSAEHRECMFHLVYNFKKKYSGKVFDDHLWPAAYSWSPYWFEKHWKAMAAAKPEATKWLQDNHKKLWTRSQFSTMSKVDYVTNNLAESFNNWIKPDKVLHLDDLMDTYRQRLMVKWNSRRKVARKMQGRILEHIVKKLKNKSRNLNMEVFNSSDGVAEVWVRGGSGYRYVVDLDERTCSCRAWQLSGKPCNHAIAVITSIDKAKLEDYVDMYFSVDKFRAAYEGIIPAIPDKSHWPESNHGFFMHPPLLKSTAGRRKENRHKGCAEGGRADNKGKHRCPTCHQFGHHWYTCKDGDPADIAALLAERGPPKKRQKARPACTETSIVIACPTRMSFPSIDNNEEAIVGPANKRKRASTPTTKSGRLEAGSNDVQVVPLSIMHPPTDQVISPSLQQHRKQKKQGKETKPLKDMQQQKKTQPIILPDSPAMGTRSRVSTTPSSPATATRSKRKLHV